MSVFNFIILLQIDHSFIYFAFHHFFSSVKKFSSPKKISQTSSSDANVDPSSKDSLGMRKVLSTIGSNQGIPDVSKQRGPIQNNITNVRRSSVTKDIDLRRASLTDGQALRRASLTEVQSGKSIEVKRKFSQSSGAKPFPIRGV